MTHTSSHPAVFAGLLGSAAWGVPKLALASPIDDAAQALSNSLLLQFVAGCAIGAALAGVVSFVADHVTTAFEKDAEAQSDEEAAAESLWRNASLSMQIEESSDEDDPTGDLGRFRTGQITIDIPAHGATKAKKKAASTAAPRHFAVAGASPATQTTRTGRHFAVVNASDRQASLVEGLREAVEVRPGKHAAKPAQRHFARIVPSAGKHFAPEVRTMAEVRSTSEPSVVPAPSSELDDTADLGRKISAHTPIAKEAAAPLVDTRTRLAKLPHVERIDADLDNTGRGVLLEETPKEAATSEDVAAVPVAYHEAKKAYGPTSEHHHSRRKARRGLRSLVSDRTRSVREALADRINSNGMAGVPIIERADGSVQDVTPTWFDSTLAPALASITGDLTGASRLLDDTSPKLLDDAARSEVSLSAMGATERAAYISRRVAEVNEGVFPARRTADELERDSDWGAAMASMDETIKQDSQQLSASLFQDVVGGPSTIDDPDGLEAPTGVLPFRSRAVFAQPAGSDQYSDDSGESSQFPQRPSSSGYLRVIEGGSGDQRARRRVSETGSIIVGRRFSPRFAQEA